MLTVIGLNMMATSMWLVAWMFTENWSTHCTTAAPYILLVTHNIINFIETHTLLRILINLWSVTDEDTSAIVI